MENKRYKLLEQIMFNLGGLHRTFATTRDGFLAKFNLSRPQMELLYSLKYGAKTTGELAKTFSVTSSAVSQMVDQLVIKGLVERISNPDDRRVTNVQVAPEAVTVFQKVQDEYISHLCERFIGVTDEELVTLLEILTKTLENMQSQKLTNKKSKSD